MLFILCSLVDCIVLVLDAMANIPSTLPSTLPNPLAPTAFLTPDLAHQFEALTYMAIATTAAYVWDWLSAMPDEFRMCRKGNRGLVLIPYFLSRICTLGSCVMSVVLQVGTIEHCEVFYHPISGFIVVGVPATLALFYLRVKAVYFDKKLVVAFFGLLWLSIFGTLFLIPFNLTLAHIGPTKRCIVVAAHSRGATPVLLHSAFDTLVFIAISIRIASYSITSSARTKSLFRLGGDGLSRICRYILWGGQVYYFATIGLCLVVVVLMIVPVGPVYKVMFIIPHVALDSSMACLVSRGLILGLIEDIDASAPTQSVRFFTRHSTTLSGRHSNAYATESKERDTVVPLEAELAV